MERERDPTETEPPPLSAGAAADLAHFRNHGPNPKHARMVLAALEHVVSEEQRAVGLLSRRRSLVRNVAWGVAGALAAGLLLTWIAPRLASQHGTNGASSGQLANMEHDDRGSVQSAASRAGATHRDTPAAETPAVVTTEPPTPDSLPPPPHAVSQSTTPGKSRSSNRRSERPGSSATHPAKSEATLDSLELELALVGRLRGAMQEGRFSDALEDIRTHENSFPRGAMIEERRAWKAIALCSRGRHDQGLNEARTFLADFPHSAHATRVSNACRVDAP